MISDSGEQILASQTTSNQVKSKQPSKQPNNQANNKQPNNQAKAQAKQQTTKHRNKQTVVVEFWARTAAFRARSGVFWRVLGPFCIIFGPNRSLARAQGQIRARMMIIARATNTKIARARCPTPGGARGSRFGPCLRSRRSGRSGRAWFGK